MYFTLLDDEEFLNFNVSATLDPTLKASDGPDQTELYTLAILGRQGDDRFAIGEFAETMGSTLQPAAFASFERPHGVRMIKSSDWFYSKLCQFSEVLLYDSIEVLGNGPEGWGAPRTDRPWEEGEHRLRGRGPSLDPNEIEAAFSPRERETYPWHEFVALCASRAPGKPILEQLRDRIKSLGRVERKRGWSKNEVRDWLILAGLAKNLPDEEICRDLDRHLIATTEGMQKVSVGTWAAAWGDPELHHDVQKLFSKVRCRKAVKR